VLQAQLAACVAVQDDVVTLPDGERIAATFLLNAFLQGQEFTTGLHGNERLKGRVDLE